MILITGANGHFGKATIDHLLKKGVTPNTIAALVRDETKATALKEKNVSIKIGDYDNYQSLVEAFTGVDKLLLISGTDVEKRGAQQINAVKAAKEAGVKFIVYTSFERKNETASSPIAILAKSHIDTENSIKESGIPYTILRNGLYADVIPMFVGDQVLEKGIFFPAGAGKVAFVTRDEMAEAAANILTGNGHAGNEYTIANNTNYSFADVAGLLGELTGKEIQYNSPDAKVFADALVAAGVPAGGVALFGGFAEAVKQGEFYAERSDLEFLLGRKPAPLIEYLRSTYIAN